MAATDLLFMRPDQYRHTEKPPAGTFVVLPLGDGRATVERHVLFNIWYPLTDRANPAWRTWPSVAEAKAEAEAEGATLRDSPHWGRP